MKDLKQKTLSGFVYKFAERGASQGISFIVQIILARLLMPEEFGTIALLTVLMTILDVFVTYGFGNSLVVNKKSDDLDFSTCFHFGLFLSLVMYGIVYVNSSYISEYFYGHDELDSLVKVMALRMPIAAINSVQHAYVAKKMKFRLFFYATLLGTVASGVVGIFMAYAGYGVWALVGQYMSNAIFSTITLWLMSDWRPKWIFSIQRLKVIYDYGWKILVVGLIDTTFSQIRSLVIAKQYTRSDLAYYNRGVSFPHFGMKMIEPTISGVLFPALSNCNDDPQMMKSITRRVIKVSTFMICAVMCFLFAAAKPIIMVLLTEKWESCVVFLQIGCIAYMLRPLNIIHNSIIRASGRSELLLKVNILNKIIGLSFLLILMPYGVEAIAWSYVIFNYITTFVHIWVNRELLKYGFLEQFRDIGVNLIVGMIMGVLVWAVMLLPLGWPSMLFVQVIVGISSFLLISHLFDVESFTYINRLIINNLKSRK